MLSSARAASSSSIPCAPGRVAIDRYDTLIVKQGGFQFLRDQREAIAQAMLRRCGLTAAQQAAGELGIPAFSSLSD
jgi:hypothetical protein